MVRTQVQLTEAQYRQLKGWAARLGVSLSEVVRRCVDERLSAEKAISGRKAMIREAVAVLGKYEDPEGLSSVALDHDRHLSEAYRR
jgi:hypothetical protein